MHYSKRPKRNHLPAFVSRKTVNRMLDLGLRAISASPAFHYFQTLTFPNPDYSRPMVDPKAAKTLFNAFLKGIKKHYGKHSMSAIYFQEQRRDETIHFHVSFLFYTRDNLPFPPSHMFNRFKADLFKRWKAVAGEFDHCSRRGNDFKEHPFNLASLEYPCRAVTIRDKTERAETNWFGKLNEQLILNRSMPVTRAERKAVFDGFFRREPKHVTLMRDYKNRRLLKQIQEQRPIVPVLSLPPSLAPDTYEPL